MKAGSKQRAAAADQAAQGQSLPAHGCRSAPADRGGVRRARTAALLFGFLSVIPAATAVSPASTSTPPVGHSSSPKPSAIHAVALPPPPQPRPPVAPAQHTQPPQPGHPATPPVNANRSYAPGRQVPAPQHAPALSPYTNNRTGAMPSQSFRPGPSLAPNSAYGTLQAQSNVRQPFSPPSQQPRLTAQAGGAASGEHLGSWMKQHQNQSLPEQENSLRQEPGFNRLAPQQQQNLVNHLHQLNQMPPEQRQRTLSRIENMEHLTPERRQAVRSSAQQLGALPEDRKRLVKKAFRDLRDLPPEQRQALMNSPQFAGQFSAQERSIMGNLLVVEPYQHAGANPPQTQNGR